MNQQFYHNPSLEQQYYTTNNTTNANNTHSFNFHTDQPPQHSKSHTHTRPKPPIHKTQPILRNSHSNQAKSPHPKPKLSDISSQESDKLANEFKKWSSQHKVHALRKAKSQTQDTLYDPPQYNNITASLNAASAVVSVNRSMAMASNSYPYSNGINGNGSQARQYYGNINNYIADNHMRGQRYYHGHTRDRSQQSQQSIHSFASTNDSTQLSNNNVSSSSEDFINNNYASPSPKMYNHMQGYVSGLNNHLSNSSNHSNQSVQSVKGLNFMHRNSNINAVFYEISRHLERCILYLENDIFQRQWINAINKDMLKVTLEFCGFDIENGKKFNILYTHLEQHLKINGNNVNEFAYNGSKLLEYLRQCLDSLINYIQSPINITTNAHTQTLLNVLYSYYIKHGLASMSITTIHAFYKICHAYRLQMEQMKKLNDKLAVVKNLFTDEIKVPLSEVVPNSKYKPHQHNLSPQISAPVTRHRLQPNPINHSKSHPELAHNQKIIDTATPGNEDTVSEDEEEEYKGNDGESTPVLSDLNEIDNTYDSEMSATPQPMDIQKAIIQQFIPNTIKTLNNSTIPPMPVSEVKEEPKMGDIIYEKSNDADDEVSSPGSMSTSTDNDTVGDNIGFKTIPKMKPTPHTSRPQNIDTVPSENNNNNAIINKKTDTPIPAKRLGKNKTENNTLGKKRQSWADITMEKIDVFVSNNTHSEFKLMKPINQQQGVANMIKEYRKSLGQSELQDTVEILRKEFGNSNSGNSNSSSDTTDIEQSDSDSQESDHDSDEFFDDDELQRAQAKYMSITGQPITPMEVSVPKPNLDTGIISNDTTSSRYKVKEYRIDSGKDYGKIMEEKRSKRGSSHGSNQSKKSKSKSKSKHSHKSGSHSRHSRESKEGGYGNNNRIVRERRRSDSATHSSHVRKITNDTAQSLRYGSGDKKQSMHTYTYSNLSNNTMASTRIKKPDLKYYNSNSSRHSRSSSEFINGTNNYKPPNRRQKSSQRYNYAFGVYDIDEQSPNSEDNIVSPRSQTNARKYQRKTSQNINENKSVHSFNSDGSSSKHILRDKRRVITAKHDQIRSNYIIRASYVDQNQKFSKYSSDRNKSWKKWIKLLQSHDSDITNVTTPAQVQTLIDFARMSLGNYGNWLRMKSNNININVSQSSLSSTKSSKSHSWNRYFAVMRDFNLFLFRNEYIPSTLNDVVNEEYLALSVAHIESVKQCGKNQSELYLEVTGSKTNHKLKFRCESSEACSQWVAEMNYQIHIVSDLCCNQSLRLECADQKRSIWIPVAPMTPLNPYSLNKK